jgi:hypothetical protein
MNQGALLPLAWILNEESGDAADHFCSRDLFIDRDERIWRSDIVLSWDALPRKGQLVDLQLAVRRRMLLYRFRLELRHHTHDHAGRLQPRVAK